MKKKNWEWKWKLKTRSSTCATLNEFGSPTKKKLVKKNKQEHGCERGNAKKGKEKQAAKPAIKSDWGEGKQKTKKKHTFKKWKNTNATQ